MNLFLALLFWAAALSAASRQVATIGDLPRGADRGPGDLASIQAMTQQLLGPFRERKIPFRERKIPGIGFVNQGHGGVDAADWVRSSICGWIRAPISAISPAPTSTRTTFRSTSTPPTPSKANPSCAICLRRAPA